MNPIEGLYQLNQRWKPHPGQIGPGQALLRGIKNIFIEAGRNWGKTEWLAYWFWRWAMTYPNTENYLFEPFQNQAREILWASNRIQTFGPQEWIESVNNTEMRIKLINGSFIKLDGADNVDARRGIKPRGLVGYDELKDIKKSFLDAMEPNRAAWNVPAVFTGTPPEFHNHFVDMMEFAKTDPKSAYFHAPSVQNPHLSREFLEREKRRLISIGAEDQWIREYEAIFVLGGKRAIFPQAARYHYPSLDSLLPKDLNHWWLIVGADPGSTSVFAVGFFLFNPYLRCLIAVDEIYEEKMERMRVRSIRDQILEKLKPWKDRNIKEIRFVYDEAAAWFANEMNEIQPDWWWTPTKKSENGKEEGIGFIRDLFDLGKLDIASNCLKLKWELVNYAKDEKGRIPKAWDHLIDVLRYVISEVGLDLKQIDPPKPPDPIEQPRYSRMEDDFDDQFSMTEIGEVGLL